MYEQPKEVGRPVRMYVPVFASAATRIMKPSLQCAQWDASEENQGRQVLPAWINRGIASISLSARLAAPDRELQEYEAEAERVQANRHQRTRTWSRLSPSAALFFSHGMRFSSSRLILGVGRTHRQGQNQVSN